MQFGINNQEVRLQKIAWAHTASTISSVEKNYECSFIPNCIRKIIWLLVNTIQVTNEVSSYNLIGWKFDMWIQT